MAHIGIWMYQNGGGDRIEKKMVAQLQERGHIVSTGLNLRYAVAENGKLILDGLNLYELDCFFSYNAGEQTKYQVYLYETLNEHTECINNFRAFRISEDKFKTNDLLRQHNIRTPDYFLCHREDVETIRNKVLEWGKAVFKTVDGWGGIGMALVDSKDKLDMILPFLNHTGLRFFYIEKFIDYDGSDFRVDLVDGEFIACYGRKAKKGDWRTNVTSGGSVILREDCGEEVIELAKKAAQAIGIEIAGVDIIYDREKEEYVVLEVNGIPAFATPEQEKLGLNFNDKKIEKIVELIEKRVKKEAPKKSEKKA
ncbi:MAG: ATP-grasp domain-containing protein [Epsilonproteobacteria bacterium]|nr:ATP-grasp domain-containing protein [Campylobacterota bacterium]